MGDTSSPGDKLGSWEREARNCWWLLFKGPQWPVSAAGPYLVGLHNPQDCTTGGYHAFKFTRLQGTFQIQTIQSKLLFCFPSKWPLTPCLFATASIKADFDYPSPSSFRILHYWWGTWVGCLCQVPPAAKGTVELDIFSQITSSESPLFHIFH